MVAGALGSDPKLIDFLRSNHRSEAYLAASVKARQAAPIIIATGEPVIALGGFSGRDPILTDEASARLVKDERLRFVLVGDGSPGLRRIFGEDGQSLWSTGSAQTAAWLTPLSGELRPAPIFRVAQPRGSGPSSTICVPPGTAADQCRA